MSGMGQMNNLWDKFPHNLVWPASKSQIWRMVQVSTLTLVLTGCGQGPTDLAEMTQTISATLAQTDASVGGDNQASVDLGAGFGRGLTAAVQGNDGYQAAIALEAETAGRIGVSKSARRTQITGNANLGALRETGGASSDVTTTGAAASVILSQLIYDGGESKAAVNQATAEAFAAQAARETMGNELALQAAKAWIDVWQFDERLRLLRDRVAAMNATMVQMERMAANGFVDRSALDSARRQVIDISLEQSRREADLNEARVRFERFYNAQPTGLPAPRDLVTLAQARTAAGAWRMAPTLQRTAAELLMARSAVASAEAAFRPKARLQAGVTSPMKATDSTDTSIGLVVQYTVGDGGRRRSQKEAAEARLQALESRLIDEQRTLEAELDAAMTKLTSLELSMPLLAEKIVLTASEAQTARSQIATGQSSLRQLVEVEIENYRALDAQIAMRAERQMLLMAVTARTGELGRMLGLVTPR